MTNIKFCIFKYFLMFDTQKMLVLPLNGNKFLYSIVCVA